MCMRNTELKERKTLFERWKASQTPGYANATLTMMKLNDLIVCSETIYGPSSFFRITALSLSFLFLFDCVMLSLFVRLYVLVNIHLHWHTLYRMGLNIKWTFLFVIRIYFDNTRVVCIGLHLFIWGNVIWVDYELRQNFTKLGYLIIERWMIIRYSNLQFEKQIFDIKVIL